MILTPNVMPKLGPRVITYLDRNKLEKASYLSKKKKNPREGIPTQGLMTTS
jgi:hypothetical protein